MATDYTQQIQNYSNILFWIFIGVMGIALIVFILYQVYTRLTYKYHVFVHKKMGDTEIIINDEAKQIKKNNNYFLHLRKQNKLAPVNDIDGNHFTSFCSIYKGTMLGFIPNTKLALHVFLDGITPFFMKVHKNPGLEPVRIDSINWVQNHVMATIKKYETTNKFVQMLPYIAIGGVIMMFIVGMIFYTKHIETISNQILNTATNQAQRIAEQGAQVIKPV